MVHIVRFSFLAVEMNLVIMKKGDQQDNSLQQRNDYISRAVEESDNYEVPGISLHNHCTFISSTCR